MLTSHHIKNDGASARWNGKRSNIFRVAAHVPVGIAVRWRPETAQFTLSAHRVVVTLGQLTLPPAMFLGMPGPAKRATEASVIEPRGLLAAHHQLDLPTIKPKYDATPKENASGTEIPKLHTVTPIIPPMMAPEMKSLAFISAPL